jgi:nitrate/nitrite-specific signal transduction histidine kinase
VTVTDDGFGPKDEAGPLARHGLLGMRERVQLLAGNIYAGRGEDGGFVVRARFPLELPLEAPRGFRGELAHEYCLEPESR